MILLVNGPNLNLLGEREPHIYGTTTLGEIERMVSDACAGYGVEVRAVQSNYEGALVDFMQEYRKEAQGIIINPGAFTHSSYALHDCLMSMPCPIVEVHLSNIHAREEWRKKDVISPATTGQIVGLGPIGYYLAALWHCQQIHSAVAADGAQAQTGDIATLESTEEIPMVGGQGEYEG